MLETETFPDIQAVDQLYRGLFEVESPDSEPVTVLGSLTIRDPVTVEDIEIFKRTWKNTAPGQDGILISQVKSCPSALLAVLYNIVLYRSHTPSVWKSNRTVIIPKEGDRKDPTNWRPITIGSALQRLLHRILASRLQNRLELHPLQRGFREIDGCLSNVILLEHYIKARRFYGKSYNLVSLDIRKAFDTVSHDSILRGLCRVGLDSESMRFIQSTLGAHTTISVGHQHTGRMYFKRGVKQGDPLSPILFNIVLDELITELNNIRPGGTLSPTRRLSALGFADDLVLLEDDDVDMALTLDHACEFFKRRGMMVNPKKCVAIAATVHAGKSVPRTKAIFRIQGAYIRSIVDVASFRYLGHYFSAYGSFKPTLHNLTIWLRNLERSPLKPSQKFQLLKSHVLPRMYHGLQVPSITGKILTECDRVVRRSVKKILHLAKTTADLYIHARIRDGGLGVPQFRRVIPFIMSQRIQKLCSQDELTSDVLGVEPSSSFVSRIARLSPEGNPTAFWRERVRTHTFSAGLEDAADDAASRAWLLHTPRGWSGRDFVRAVQLRTNNLPTASLPYRTEKQCRGGCNVEESLCHILQSCRVLYRDRILRHNEVVKKIARHCRSKGWFTEVEPRVHHTDSTLYIPDLVIHYTQDEHIICDIQVSWESTRSSRTLADAWEAKRLVYDHPKFREAALRSWPDKSFKVLPIIVGARGIWPRSNRTTVEALSIPAYLRRSCVNSCLKWGSTLHRRFTASVWRRRPPRATGVAGS